MGGEPHCDPTHVQPWPMSLSEPVHVFQVLSNGPPSLCPPLLPCWPFPGLSDQASCYQSGREQTRDPGDMGDAKESLQDRQPTQRLWEASVFWGKRPETVTRQSLLAVYLLGSVSALTLVIGAGGEEDLKRPKDKLALCLEKVQGGQYQCTNQPGALVYFYSRTSIPFHFSP